MSLSIVTHGYIGGTGFGGTRPPGPAEIIPGPSSLDLEQLRPYPTMAAESAGVVPSAVSTNEQSENKPKPTDVKAYKPRPVGVR